MHFVLWAFSCNTTFGLSTPWPLDRRGHPLVFVFVSAWGKRDSPLITLSFRTHPKGLDFFFTTSLKEQFTKILKCVIYSNSCHYKPAWLSFFVSVLLVIIIFSVLTSIVNRCRKRVNVCSEASTDNSNVLKGLLAHVHLFLTQMHPVLFKRCNL